MWTWIPSGVGGREIPTHKTNVGKNRHLTKNQYCAYLLEDDFYKTGKMMFTLFGASHFQKTGNRVSLLAGISPDDVAPSHFYHGAVTVLSPRDKHRSPRQDYFILSSFKNTIRLALR